MSSSDKNKPIYRHCISGSFLRGGGGAHEGERNKGIISTLWGVPKIRTVAGRGLYWGPPISGNYQWAVLL